MCKRRGDNSKTLFQACVGGLLAILMKTLQGGSTVLLQIWKVTYLSGRSDLKESGATQSECNNYLLFIIIRTCLLYVERNVLLML